MADNSLATRKPIPPSRRATKSIACSRRKFVGVGTGATAVIGVGAAVIGDGVADIGAGVEGIGAGIAAAGTVAGAVVTGNARPPGLAFRPVRPALLPQRLVIPTSRNA